MHEVHSEVVDPTSDFYDRLAQYNQYFEGDEAHGLLAEYVNSLHFQVPETYISERELAEMKRELKELREMATLDTLTGLPNERGLRLAYDRIQAQRERDLVSQSADSDSPPTILGLVLLDVDNFKEVNDDEQGRGHDDGDRGLLALANAMRNRLRKTDTAARLHGDEFVILLETEHKDSLIEIINEIREQLAQDPDIKEDLNKFLRKLTFSCGIAIVRQGELIEDGLYRADQALYDAKRNGRNTHAFSD